MSVSKAGYAPRRVAVAAVPSEGLSIGLPRGAAVTGVVIDEFGDPVAGITVRVRRNLDPSESTADTLDHSTETDDLGEFRIGSLPAGRYGVELDASAFNAQTMRQEGAGAQEGLGFSSGLQVFVLGGSQRAAAAQTDVQLRAGREAAVTLAYNPGKAPTDSVAAFAAGFEDGGRAARAALGQAATSGASKVETGVIRGRISGPTGRAVGGALVRLSPVARGSTRVAATDARGAYEISGVAPGSYRLSVSKSGSTTVDYGQERVMQQGRTLLVRQGERLERIDVALPRGGAISGAILDEGGEPLEGIAVQVWQARFARGRTIVLPVTGVLVRRTDDRGHYRIHGLLPGTYYVVAMDDRSFPPNDWSIHSPDGTFRVPNNTATSSPNALRVFYPGRTSVAEAVPLQMDIAGHVGGVDMTFTPVPGVRVSGTALSSSGRPASGPILLTVSGRSGEPTLPPQTARTGADGRFEFTDVAPGEYVVQAIQPSQGSIQVLTTTAGGDITVTAQPAPAAGRSGPPAPGEFGMQHITASGAAGAQVAITTRPGSTLKGRIVLEGDRELSPSSLRLSAVPTDFDLSPVVTDSIAPRSSIAADLTFEMSNLFGPGRIAVSAPEGWWLKSVNIDGIEAADEPVTFGTSEQSRSNVEVVLSSRSATLSGRVRDNRDVAVNDYSVVVFPTDTQRWYDGSRYMKLARPGQDGRFEVSGLPPGEYWVAAVSAIDGDAGYGGWQNPDVLNGLTSGARRVTVAEAQRATMELRVVRR